MRKLLLFVLLLGLFSCKEVEVNQLCAANDPVNNLKWLKNLIEEIESDPKYVSVVITAYEYQGKSVFNIQDMISSCAFCDLRDCSGRKYTPTDFSDFLANKKNEHKIWCQNPQLCD